MMKGYMRRVPTVVSLDATPLNFDTMAAAYCHSRQGTTLESLKLGINRRALLNATAIVTWSRWAARSVIEDYGVPPSRVHPIHPGVNVERFRPRLAPRQSGPPRILFVGGDFARKGGPELVAAVAALGGAFELDIVTGTSDVYVPRGAPIRVHNNVVPNSQKLLDLLGQADVFALPTLGECFGLAIAEAMASGLPIVATRVGPIPEMVRDGVNGLLVNPGEPAEIAGALSALQSDPARTAQMARASRSIAEEYHDAAKNWREIFALMRSAVSSSSASRP
jgi:glycosyltransferase involved in cell wall biosynthesis